ncbi:restriction endonuclease subunit S [Halomonas piscis]|uniref:Restriction endonuclease subunit S n=1 Tax=Halomonas piscis TaxID=3031727 RepID=A0ABY9YZI6_9GAMM|nr:restriction endonuclease subunit S [Halomonas piscis]WNK19474.1 restriction endonuclease subunit S [Halomonas piscis]
MAEQGSILKEETVRDTSPTYSARVCIATAEGVPLGYKRTEVGVIPRDWRIQKIDQLAMLGRGRVISHNEIRRSINQQYPVFSSQTSNEGLMGYIDSYDFDGEYVTWTTDGVNAGRVFHRTGRFNCTNVCGTLKIKEGIDIMD